MDLKHEKANRLPSMSIASPLLSIVCYLLSIGCCPQVVVVVLVLVFY